MVKWFMALTVVALLAIGAAACGGGDDDDGNGGDGGTEPTSAATSAATAAPTQADDGDDDGDDEEELTLVALNTLFDKSELEAEAGEVTITMDNQDAGIAHNLEVFDGPDENATMLGATEIENGPVEQTLTLTLEPGEYFYWCVVHPATMSGKLIVE